MQASAKFRAELSYAKLRVGLNTPANWVLKHPETDFK